MGSDRARITYDKSRQYRAVVMQQGRVTVEADWNEEGQIVNEETRKEALDFVGPNGTPDNGYQVMETGQAPTIPFDFTVNKGTMYVGGERAYTADSIQYSQQLDWLDHSDDPADWVDPSTLANAQLKNEFVYLYLREQEVSAVEDSALREVALGGPDTAARLRLIQHIVRLGVDATDCASALKQAERYWQTEGLHFDDQTMRLSSKGTLQVSFPDVVTTPGPCEPQAQGGYLGADNQLIRVQIANANQDGTYSLVWGYDNASFLYRVTVDPDLQTLHLQSRPVDDFHKPRANQAVEVLRSAAQLCTTTNDYVASATGIVTTLEEPYASNTQSITLPSPIGKEYNGPSQTPVVFLRVWEEEKPFTPGTAVLLGTTGVQVTLKTSDGGPFHVGDYWLFAVRPDTAADPNASTEVFPHRYLEGPQSPEGPRLWACPLAVIQWNSDGVLTVLEDCRNPFDNLVELTKRNLGGCCTVTVRPEDITGNKTLQSILDKYSHQERVTVCLMPGTYALLEPLRLGPQHSNLTLEGCHKGVIIQAKKGSEDQFLDGLIVLNGTNNVTLQGLRFDPPLASFFSRTLASSRIAGLHSTEVRNILGAQLQGLQVSIGIRSLHCGTLTIKDCLFYFPQAVEQSVFGAGIFAGSACYGLTVQGNQFVRPGDVLSTRERPFGFLFGYLLVPTTTFNAGSTAATTTTAIAARGGTTVFSLLQDATFQDNLFTGLSAAALIYADTGAVRFERNIVRNCYAGFWLLSLLSLSNAALIDNVSVPSSQFDFAQQLAKWVLETMNDPLVQIGTVLARSYSLSKEFDVSQAIQVGPIKVSKTGAKAEADYAAIQAFFNKALQTPSTGTVGGTTEEKQVKLNPARIPLINSLFASQTGLGRFSALQSLLATTERAALAARTQPTALHLALHMSDNDIDAVLPNNMQSSTALLVWDNALDNAGTMTMSANKVRNRSFMPAALMLSIERCAITGNLILNEEQQERLAVLSGGQNYLSLILPFGVGVAITGNVFQGVPLLPSRTGLAATAPVPMNAWEFLNTVI